MSDPSTINHQLSTILVTGGAGYIGAFTVRELLNNNFDVVVLDSLENGHREAIDSRAKLEVVNLNNTKATAEVFDKYKIDAVIDFAAYLAVGESMENPKKYIENNVINFVKLLDVMKEKNCKYIIKSSTASTYGDPLDEKSFPLKEIYQDLYRPEKSALLPGIWNEEKIEGEAFFQKIIDYYKTFFQNRPDLNLTDQELTKLRIPTSIYGLTKLLDEIILEKYNQASVLKYVVLRYFNVCGADLDGNMGDCKPVPTNLMTLVVLNALNKTESLKVFGADYPTKDGTGIRDYIHPLDLANGHVASLQYLIKNDKSEVLNLGSGDGYSVFEVIHAVEAASGKMVTYEVVPRRSGDVIISTADCSKAQNLLNWKAKYNLDQMAQSAWKWHSQHPNGYTDSTIDS